MLLAILLGFAAAFLAPVLHRYLGSRASWVLAVLPLGQVMYFGSFLPQVVQGQAEALRYSWVPQLNINFYFVLDGLSLLFALLISGFGFLIILYAGYYMKNDAHAGRFYLYLLLFMSAMLGVVLADNLLLLFVFWELTSLSSYLLIGFKNNSETARNAALQALLVTGLGGLCLMAGFILLGLNTGSFNLSDIILTGNHFQQHPLYQPVLLLILLGAFTKSAQFPFHFWLPNAMAAPTPVSAYLHSATMVKAGIYLLARLNPVLGHTPEWQVILLAIGGITMLLGAFLAIHQYDLKAMLAYSTISSLGMLVLLLGLGTTYAIKATVIFLLGHALYKGALFLIAGSIDKATGTRDIRELGGLWRKMPVIAVASFLACLSMAGVIPFFGFIAKETLYQAALDAPVYATLLIAAVLLANVLTVAVAVILTYELFFGPVLKLKNTVKPVPASLYLPPVVLALTGLGLGLFPAVTAQPLLSQSIYSILNKEEVLKLVLWHGFNLVLLLSVLTLLLGYFLYLFRKTFRKLSDKLIVLNKAGPGAIYQWLLSGLKEVAYLQTIVLQNGYLRSYISVVLIVFIGCIIAVVWHYELSVNMLERLRNLNEFRVYEIVMLSVMLVALIFVFRTKSRLTAIATMGLIGYSIALLFVFYGAPDVAITQFLIETLTVVLFVLIIHKLPSFRLKTKQKLKYKYLILATLFGGTMTYVLLLVKVYPRGSVLKEYFGSTSVLLGKGQNMVNVILVDYRALDTLGEITVLAVAAIGITALLRLKLKEGGDK
ncbi:MAG: putative monovalent cation/H+ antiporter subunit A [Hymenobacteraceae bacterium]|nr:putative monovalent cation/H+ antiporter subunit A [Hymenobacteraceae bacterium]MDX5397609.1 putative monovalent cation/H+ antiporter subunit A [Hymenobacteraceae bacterium]MDX5513689.1 putative monovalent cation/H+ antiporter subunit A [Hymenobacteraceae bacterium]